MLDIFFIGLRKDKYVVKVNHYKLSEVILKDKVHKPLESDECVIEFKWHSEVFILPSGHYECSLMDIFFSDLYLPVFCY